MRDRGGKLRALGGVHRVGGIAGAGEVAQDAGEGDAVEKLGCAKKPVKLVLRQTEPRHAGVEVQHGARTAAAPREATPGRDLAEIVEHRHQAGAGEDRGLEPA